MKTKPKPENYREPPRAGGEDPLNRDVLSAALLNNLPQKIFLKDSNSVYITCNNRYARDLGIKPAGIKGRTDLDFFPPELASAYRKDDRKVIETGEILEVEEKYVEGGEEVFVHTVKVPVRDKSGAVTGVLGMFWDITDRKRMESELREARDLLEARVEKRTALLKKTIKGLQESETKFRTLFENISPIIIIHGFDGEILEANESAARALGCPREELPGNSIQDLETGEFAENFSGRMAQLRKDGSLLCQSAYIRPDGASVPVETRLKIFNYGGREAVLSAAADITERLEHERALEESSENLRLSLERSVEALAAASEKRDPYTSGHHFRVCRLSLAMAAEMGLPESALYYMEIAAKIHDIGKLYIPAEILDKPYKLSPAEFAIITAHSSVGYDIVKKMDFAGPVARTILQHHERMDGSGYPLGLSSKDISLEAKILAVADVVEAMTAHRPYRPAHTITAALEEILKGANILFDREAASACVELFNSKNFKFPPLT